MENENISSGADHEAMRVLILSRFEDDVLRRQEVELWLEGLVQPGNRSCVTALNWGFATVNARRAMNAESDVWFCCCKNVRILLANSNTRSFNNIMASCTGRARCCLLPSGSNRLSTSSHHHDGRKDVNRKSPDSWRCTMSIQPAPIDPVPDETIRVARAAFPGGNPYLTLRDQLGDIFQDDHFADLYPGTGKSGLSPWRLAWVTILQFRETLSDRQAAEAVRARIDWKYLLGLDLTDCGFDFSVLSEFRGRLLAGNAPARLLDQLLARCQAQGLLKSRGRQRTDSTHVLAAIRTLNRLELVSETLRAALNEVAREAPEWLQGVVPLAWYERYGRRIEDSRLPREPSKRDAYAQSVGADGFTLLDALDDDQAPARLRHLP